MTVDVKGLARKWLWPVDKVGDGSAHLIVFVASGGQISDPRVPPELYVVPSEMGAALNGARRPPGCARESLAQANGRHDRSWDPGSARRSRQARAHEPAGITELASPPPPRRFGVHVAPRHILPRAFRRTNNPHPKSQLGGGRREATRTS